MARYRPIVFIKGLMKQLAPPDTLEGVGNMDTQTYDPTGIANDIFNRQFHTGTQPYTTVSGLGTAATMNVGTVPNTVASGDHTHLCGSCDMSSDIYDPTGIEENVYDRQFHTGVQLLSSIADAGNAAGLNVGTGPNTVASGDHTHPNMGTSLDASVYDPTGVGADAFARVNHTGTQPYTTVSGLGTCAILDVGTGPNTVAAGDHVHDAYLLRSIYDPQNVMADVFARANHTGTQPLSTIEDVEMVGATATSNGRGGIVPSPLAGQHTWVLQGSGTWVDPETLPGIMLKSVYDADNDGVFDNATSLNGVTADFLLDRTNHTGVQDVSTIVGVEIFESFANKNQPNGYAGLDSEGKLFLSQVPSVVTNGLRFVTTWNATTNTPPIPAASTSNKGEYYRVSTSGTTLIDGESDWQAGDYIVSEGTQWSKIDNSDFVASVAGRHGDVTVALSDMTDYLGVPTDGQVLAWSATTSKWVPTSVSVGDMLASTYDPTHSGVVNDAARLAGQSPSHYLDRANHTGTQSVATITGIGAGATAEFGTTATDLARGNHTHAYGNMFGTNNLAELTDPAAARAHLELTVISVSAFGTGVEDVARGNHSHSIVSLTDYQGVPTDGQVLAWAATTSKWVATTAATGDMLASTYDPTHSGVVNDSSNLGGQLPSHYLDRANHTGTVPSTGVTGLGAGATAAFGTGASDIARGNHTHPYGNMFGTNNLSELTDPALARSALELDGPLLTASFGTGPEDVARGNHTHALSTLLDMDVSPMDGQVLTYNLGTTAWTAASPNTGDMIKALYDVDGDGTVDDSNRLGGQLPAFYLDRANHTGVLPVSGVTGLGVGATAVFGTGASDVARGTHTHPYGNMFGGNNLAELTDLPLARSRLGLSTAATAAFGTGESDVARGNHSHSILGLSDTDGTAWDFAYLRFNGTTWTPGSITLMLDDLSDVAATSPDVGDTIAWTGTQWEHTSVGAIAKISEMSDLVGSPVVGQVIKYVGPGWEPGDLPIPAPVTDLHRNRVYDIASNRQTIYEGVQIIDELTNTDNFSALVNVVCSNGTLISGGTGAVLVQSVSWTAPTPPKSAYVVFELEEFTPISLNVDLLCYVTCDATTWEPVNMLQEIRYSGGVRIIQGVHDFTVATGTSLSFKFTTSVASSFKIRTLTFGWGTDFLSRTNRASIRTAPLHMSSHSEKVVDFGATNGTLILDADVANVYTMTPNSPYGFQLANCVAGRAHTFTLIITNGGAFEVSWPGVQWVTGEVAPTLRISGVNVVTLITLDATTIYGSYVQ